MNYTFRLTIVLLLLSFRAWAQTQIISNKLEILPITPHSFLHISYIQYKGSNVGCNGLVYMNGNEAVIMDTPTNDSVSNELMDWMAKEYPQVKIKAIIVNHFHSDCLGGLKAFHDRGIPSYANALTLKLAKKERAVVPQHGFKKTDTLKVGNTDVVSAYYGAAHTKDNIVTWIPSEKILFGGCMVKEVGAGKGNIADADLHAWPTTIKHVRDSYPSATIIIPGHGQYGDKQLLDYTIDLFSK